MLIFINLFNCNTWLCKKKKIKILQMFTFNIVFNNFFLIHLQFLLVLHTSSFLLRKISKRPVQARNICEKHPKMTSWAATVWDCQSLVMIFSYINIILVKAIAHIQLFNTDMNALGMQWQCLVHKWGNILNHQIHKFIKGNPQKMTQENKRHNLR